MEDRTFEGAAIAIVAKLAIHLVQREQLERFSVSTAHTQGPAYTTKEILVLQQPLKAVRVTAAQWLFSFGTNFLTPKF